MEAVLTRPAGNDVDSRRAFLLIAAALAGAAALLAGWAPLGFSVVTVFLFAGPHNWFEARYFLTRLPARWGKLRGYFALAFAGIFGLTAAFAALPWLGEIRDWDDETWAVALSIWNTAFVAWVAVLVQLRSRQNPRRDWFWTLPVAFVLAALAWQAPALWGLGMVYAHPLLALWILDRELKRSRPNWRPAYHACLACVPLLLGVLWWKLAGAPPLPGADALSARITRHAGGEILEGLSTHLLVSTHTFLEMLHYSVWLLAIPLIGGLRGAPWQLGGVPLARRSPRWRGAVVGILGVGLAVVLLLWACFAADYPATRDVYFTVAMLHVLAEIPFLLRAL